VGPCAPLKYIAGPKSCINLNKEVIMSKRDIMKEIANTFKCPGNCENDFQDGRYGKGVRVFTTTHKDNKDGKRCTVCKTTA
jgi:hypothetical protein